MNLATHPATQGGGALPDAWSGDAERPRDTKGEKANLSSRRRFMLAGQRRLQRRLSTVCSLNDSRGPERTDNIGPQAVADWSGTAPPFPENKALAFVGGGGNCK